MADDDTQGPEETAWGASDAPPDSFLPSMAFGEPVIWPESAGWDDIAGPAAFAPIDTEGDTIFLPPVPDIADVAPLAATVVDDEADAPPSPDPAESDAQWRPTDDYLDPDVTLQRAGPLAGLGGGSGPEVTDTAGDEPPGDGPSDHGLPVAAPALGSIWSNDLRAEPHELVGFGGVPAPAIYADTERNARGPSWRRFDVRPGNAAVIGLISVVSLVLLGMFLSVRARNNDVPTDASQTRPAGDVVAVTGPLNTIPPPTSTTSTTTAPAPAPTPAINLSDLLAATEVTSAPTGSSGGTGTAATTTPTPRAAAPTGGDSATTTPATQPTATTSPPTPTTEATSPPPPPAVEDTPTTTRRTTPTPTFTIPNISIPNLSIPNSPRVPSLRSDD